MIYEDRCFDAQQAAEKALKGHIGFPKTHSITELLTLIHQCVDVPLDIQEAGRLTGYAVDSRYPGVFEEINEQEYIEAVRLADALVRWVERILATEVAG